MNKIAFVLVVVLGVLAGTNLEARRHCCRRGSSGAALGFFAGAFAGAAIASSCDRNYYVDMPTYDVVYRGAPLLAYDYPTYVYSPMYAYPNTLYTYPGYFWAY